MTAIASIAHSALLGTTDVALLSLVLVPLLLEMRLLVLFPMLGADVDDVVDPAAATDVVIVVADDDATVVDDDGEDVVDAVAVLATGAAVATDVVVAVVLPVVALGCC